MLTIWLLACAQFVFDKQVGYNKQYTGNLETLTIRIIKVEEYCLNSGKT